MLLVPKNDTNLRNSADCSLLCFEEPSQKVASAPDSFLMARSFWLTSLSAWSQLIFCHLPPTSFIGDLRRCESWCMPCSRIDAPLAQCAPRLIGESNTGSCRIHTPFCTTASTEQPTDQRVQTVRLVSVLPAASSLASARSTILKGSCDTTAPAPSVIPERCRNVRRSMVLPSIAETERESRRCAAPAWPVVFLVSSMV